MLIEGETNGSNKTERYAELVCSNSFGSQTDYSAPGQLKWEAESLGSLNLMCAKKASVPAGMAMGVDRHIFSELVTKVIHEHPNISVELKMVSSLNSVPRPTVIATGPLGIGSIKHISGDLPIYPWRYLPKLKFD